MSQPTPSANSADAPVDPVAQRRSRLMLVALFALFGFPLLLATGWLHMVRSSGGDLGSTSRGELIDPARPLSAFALTDLDGEAFSDDSLRGIWTMLYVPEGRCEEACQRNLYHMRQVRLALNHRMDRVQRAVILEDTQQLDAELLAQHPGLQAATGDAEQRAALTRQIDAAEDAMSEQADSIFLIDPLGNLMLRFATDLPPKSMLKDLKHLLKVSRIG